MSTTSTRTPESRRRLSNTISPPDQLYQDQRRVCKPASRPRVRLEGGRGFSRRRRPHNRSEHLIKFSKRSRSTSLALDEEKRDANSSSGRTGPGKTVHYDDRGTTGREHHVHAVNRRTTAPIPCARPLALRMERQFHARGFWVDGRL